MNQDHTLEESRDRAALYTIGALQDDDLREFEHHLLVDACAMCAAEVAEFSSVTEDLVYALPLQTPPSALRSRVLNHVAVQGMTATHPVIEKDQQKFVSAQWLNWKPGNAPGIEMKVLSVDKERALYTTLVRMAPGSSILSHRHADIEESYIMEGELLVSGVLMRPGDYCRAEAGSMHTGVTTKTGCVFISVASLNDEWFAEA